MDNQHKLIKGYRDLSAEEIALMNEVKAHAEKTRELYERVEAVTKAHHHNVLATVLPFSDESEAAHRDSTESRRWQGIAVDHLQQGYMALIRSIALPGTF